MHVEKQLRDLKLKIAQETDVNQLTDLKKEQAKLWWMMCIMNSMSLLICAGALYVLFPMLKQLIQYFI
jgi:hypothetical protein